MMQSSYIHRTVTQYGRSSAKGERSGTSLLLVIVVFEYLLIYTLVSLLCKVYIANKEVQFSFNYSCVTHTMGMKRPFIYCCHSECILSRQTKVVLSRFGTPLKKVCRPVYAFLLHHGHFLSLISWPRTDLVLFDFQHFFSFTCSGVLRHEI